MSVSSGFHEFSPGQHVNTREGIVGVVDEVVDGPHPGNETYLVSLEGGLGGGEYHASELRPISDPFPADYAVRHFRDKARTAGLAADDYPHLADAISEHLPSKMVGVESFLQVASNAPVPKVAAYLVVTEDGYVVEGPFTSRLDAQAFADQSNELTPGARVYVTHEDAYSARFGRSAVSIPRTAGFWDQLTGKEPIPRASFPWCRFLGSDDSHCHYPKELDVEGTAQAGYPVWVPFDRGLCPHFARQSQKEECPVSEPGSRSQEAVTYPDATESWWDGGQRMSVLDKVAFPARLDGSRIVDVVDVTPEGGVLSNGEVVPARRLQHPRFHPNLGLNPADRGEFAPLFKGAATSDVPPEPGQSPLPSGTVRMYHVTSIDNLDSVRRNGLTLSSAKGETYGEPNLVWFSNKLDYFQEDSFNILVEVAIPTSAIEGAGFGVAGRPSGNMGVPFDIPPQWVLAIHEPWHFGYRYLDEYREEVKAGEYDRVSDDPRYGPAIERIKREGKLSQRDPEDPGAGVRTLDELIDDDIEFAGLVIKSVDSGRVLLTQRTPYEGDPEGVYGRFEFPGGSIGEDAPVEGAIREFTEETGLALPDGWYIDGGYRNGSYLAVLVLVPNEAWTSDAHLLMYETEGLGWFHPDDIEGSELIREEMDDADWDLIREAMSSEGATDLSGIAAEAEGLAIRDGDAGRQLTDPQGYARRFAPTVSVFVRDEDFDTFGFDAQTGGFAVEDIITLRPGSAWEMSVLHEVAHVLTGGGGHTSAWLQTYYGLLNQASLDNAAELLRMSARRQGVTLRGALQVVCAHLAKWADVQAKAKAIKDSGGVRITFVAPEGQTHPWVVGEITSTSGKRYRTQLSRFPGRKAIADFACSCPWDTYAFDRSPPFAHLEARLCSHAEALRMEAESREYAGTLPEAEDPEGGVTVHSPVYWPRASMLKVAAGNGVMVAIRPPDWVLDDLVATGVVTEPYEALHVTLAYLGGAGEVDRDALLAAVVGWAESAPQLVGRVAGYGTFHNGTDAEGNVLWANLDVPRLDEWRASLIATLEAHGLTISNGHGFTPHCTLSYSDTPFTDVPDTVPQGEFIIGEVVVAHGGDWTVVPAEGEAPTLEAVATEHEADVPPWQSPASSAVTSGPRIEGPEVGLGEEFHLSAYSNVMGTGTVYLYRGEERIGYIDWSYRESDDTVYILRAGIPKSENRRRGYGTAMVAAMYKFNTWLQGSPIYTEQSSENTDAGNAFLRSFASGADLGIDWCLRCGVATDEESGSNFCEDHDPGRQAITPRGGGTYEPAVALGIADREGVAVEDVVSERLADVSEAILHDEPEPALPVTYSDDSDDGVGEGQGGRLIDPDTGEELPDPDEIVRSGALDHIDGDDTSDAEIAEAAAEFLKTALKTFTPEEQRELIEEGEREGVMARNLESLDIAGTHYELLDAESDDEMAQWMWESL